LALLENWAKGLTPRCAVQNAKTAFSKKKSNVRMTEPFTSFVGKLESVAPSLLFLVESAPKI
jgi:hypothetical protein